MTKKYRIFFIVIMLAAVFFFATYELTESPHTWYDEGAIIQRAINFLRYGTMHYQVAPGEFSSAAFDSTGYPVIYPISLAFKYFGTGLLQARAVMVAFLLLLVGLSYLLIERTAGFFSAAAAVLLLGTFPPLYGNGKNVLGEIPGLFFLVAFLFCLHRLEKDNFRNKLFLILGGLAAGLCISTKPPFLMLLPALALALLVLRKKEIFNLNVFKYFLLPFLIPVILFFYTQFMPTDSLGKIFSYYRNPYNLADWPSVMFQNFTRFFTESTPVYFGIFFLVWLVSFVLRARLGRSRVILSESAALILAIFVFLAYLRTPGWYRYFFIAHVLVLIYFPFSFSHLLKRFLGSGRIKLIFISVFFIAIGSLQLYSLGFHSWVAAYYGHTTSHALRGYFDSFDSSKSVFVYDAPEILTFLPNEKYYQYLSLNDTGMYEVGAEQIPVINQGLPDFVILSVNEENLDRFARYQLKDRVAGYLILARK